MDLINTAALSGAAAWGSGLNVYAVIGVLGLLAATGHASLAPELAVLSHPLVISAAAFMYCLEFLTDKIPGLDTLWDAIHTFVRIPAGAVLAAGAAGELEPGLQVAALVLGGSLAASSHALKAGSRVAINTSPEPLSNWSASIGEDLLVFAGLWSALNYPVLFLIALLLFVIAMIWVLPKLWHAFRTLFETIRGWFNLRAGRLR